MNKKLFILLISLAAAGAYGMAKENSRIDVLIQEIEDQVKWVTQGESQLMQAENELNNIIAEERTKPQNPSPFKQLSTKKSMAKGKVFDLTKKVQGDRQRLKELEQELEKLAPIR